MGTTHSLQRLDRPKSAEHEAADGRPSTPSTAGPLPGTVGAALIAAGVGSTVLGIAIVAVEASAAIKEWAAMGTAAGPLTGKALVAAASFFLVWAVLRTVLRDRAVSARATAWTTTVLVAIGVLLTFPPIYGLFHGG
jgi:hypothetical protein